MNLFEYIPMIANEHHEEIIKEIRQEQILKEALGTKRSSRVGNFNFLAFVRKELASLGFSLEMRYGGQIESQVSLKQQSNPEGCA